MITAAHFRPARAPFGIDRASLAGLAGHLVPIFQAMEATKVIDSRDRAGIALTGEDVLSLGGVRGRLRERAPGAPG